VKEKKIEDTRAHTRLHGKSERRRRKEVGETRCTRMTRVGEERRVQGHVALPRGPATWPPLVPSSGTNYRFSLTPSGAHRRGLTTQRRGTRVTHASSCSRSLTLASSGRSCARVPRRRVLPISRSRPRSYRSSSPAYSRCLSHTGYWYFYTSVPNRCANCFSWHKRAETWSRAMAWLDIASLSIWQWMIFFCKYTIVWCSMRFLSYR